MALLALQKALVGTANFKVVIRAALVLTLCRKNIQGHRPIAEPI
jgi:hypothetical protein